MSEKIFTFKNYFWLLSAFIAFICSLFLINAISVAITSWTGISLQIIDGLVMILTFPLYIMAAVKVWTIR